MKSSIKRGLSLLTLLLFTLLAVQGTLAVSCGNIAVNTTMDQDLQFNGTTCFTINTSNVFFDCAGYSIEGNHSPGGAGIEVANNVVNTTITNCQVSKFHSGVSLGGSTNFTNVTNTTTNSTTYGIRLANTDYNYMFDIRAYNATQAGIFLGTGASYNNFTNITVQSSVSDTAGIVITNAGILVKYNNSFVGLNISILGNGTGIRLPPEDKAVNTHIDCQGGTISGNDTPESTGIYLQGADDLTLNNCTIVDFDRGIFTDGDASGGSYMNLNISSSLGAGVNLTPTTATGIIWSDNYICGSGNIDVDDQGSNVWMGNLCDGSNPLGLCAFNCSGGDDLVPMTSFVSPTPANNSEVTVNYTYVNITSRDGGKLHQVVVDWNKTLVGWWRFNNESGENHSFFRDWSTYENNATCSTSPELCPDFTSSGSLGGGYLFSYNATFKNATNQTVANYTNDTIIIPHHASLQLGNTLTISTWIRNFCFIANRTADCVILMKSPDNKTSASYMLEIINQSNNLLAQFCVNGSVDGQAGCVRSTTNISTYGEYTHLTGTWNGTVLSLYINGTLDNSTTYAGSMTENTGNLTLGGRPDDAGEWFQGTIGDLLIFNRTLAATEIAALHNANATQYEHNFTNLSDKDYTFRAYGQDTFGNVQDTGLYTITVDAISTCGYLNKNHTLLNDVEINGSTCFTFNTSNIILDCNGYSITGNDTANTDAINMNGFDDNTVQNCYIYDFAQALDFTSSSHNNSIINVTSTSSDQLLYMTYSEDNYFYNISAYNTSGISIRLEEENHWNNFTKILIEDTSGSATDGIYLSDSNGFNENNTFYDIKINLSINGNSDALNIGLKNDNNSFDCAGGWLAKNGGPGFSSTYGAFIEGSDAITLRNCTITGDFRWGIFVDDLSSDDSLDNLIEDNNVSDIEDYAIEFGSSANDGSTVRNNYFCDGNVTDAVDGSSNTWSGNFCDSSSPSGLCTFTCAGLANAIVQSVTLTPTNATTSDNLNCTFNITDANVDDTLTANITWYRNGVANLTTNVSVQNGNFTSAILTSGNTSDGDSWLCEVRPYDGTGYGAAVNSSAVYIDQTAPNISFVPPTPANNSWINDNYVYLNVSSSDNAPEHSVIVDWNNSLVGWWRFNNETGENSTLFRDWSSYERNATCSGSACPAVSSSGKYDSSLDFTQTESDRIQFDMVNLTNVTITAWIYFDSSTSDAEPSIVDLPGYEFTYRRVSNQLRFRSQRSTTDGHWRSPNSAVSQGQWRFIAVTYDNSSTTNDPVLYVDGDDLAESEIGTPAGNTDIDNSGLGYIGNNEDNNDDWHGNIDNVAIYSRILTEEEINASYHATNYQYERNLTGLTDGNYTFVAYAQDPAGFVNTTRLSSIVIDTTNPTISFIPPTIANNSVRTKNWTYINVSSADENTNHTLLLDWNQTLVGWWRFNNEAGENDTFFKGWSSYGNNGTCSSGLCPTLNTAGKFGAAYQFDGDDDVINTTLDFSVQEGEPYTFTAWMKTAETYTGSNDSGNILGVHVPSQAPSLDMGVGEYTAGGFRAGAANKFWLYQECAVTPYNQNINSEIVDDGEWHFVAAGRLANGTLWTSVDGKAFQYNGTENCSLSFDRTVVLGAYSLSLSRFTFNGSIDDIQIHKRELTIEEINATYQGHLNQYEKNFSDLANGNYTFLAHAQDLAGNVNSTETRSFLVTDPPACGTITTDTTLEFNLTSNGTCFIIGASGITLDGAGYTVTGNTTGYAVDNTGGFDNVVIKDFAGLNNFTNGVILESSAVSNTIENNTIVAADVSSGYGIYLNGDTTTLVHNNTITTSGSSGYGVQLTSSSSTANLSENSITVSGNGHAILLNGADDAIVANNVLVTTGGGEGVALLVNADRNSITDNVITTSSVASAYGVHLSGDTNTTVFNNTITTSGASGHGILLSSVTITANLTQNNITTTSSGYGVYVGGANDSVFSRNVINTTGGGPGIYLITDADRNSLKHNTVTTSGASSAYAIFLTGDTNTTLFNNTISTRGANGYGVRVDPDSITVNISQNNIATVNTSAHGIYLNGADDATVVRNIINTTGDGEGIYLISFAERNILQHNTITTSTSSGSLGVYLTGDTNTTSFNNTITTGATNSHGIQLDSDSITANLTQNTITASGSGAYGIYLNGADDQTINRNTVTTSGGGEGIVLLSNADRNMLQHNTITTDTSTFAYGVLLFGDENTTAYNNTITTSTTSSYGFYLSSSAINANLTENVITATGSSGHGLYLTGTASATIANNRINTTGSDGYGLYFLSSANNNVFSLNNITTSDASGIYLTDSSHNNTFDSDVVSTTGASDHGIHITDSSENNFTGVNITATGSNSDGILVSNSYGLLFSGVNSSYAGASGINISDVNSTGSTIQNSVFCSAGLVGAHDGDNNTWSNNTCSTQSGSAVCDTVCTPVLCGNISESKTLYENIESFGSTCFNITANHITLDCNEFWITGNQSPNTYGVNITGRTNVTLIDCKIRNFSTGLLINNSINSTVINLTSDNNTDYGVLIEQTSTGNNFTGFNSYTPGENRTAFLVSGNGADSNTIDCAGGLVQGNDSSGSLGIHIDGSDYVTVQNCTLQDFDDGLYTSNIGDYHEFYNLLSSSNIDAGFEILGALDAQGDNLTAVQNNGFGFIFGGDRGRWTNLLTNSSFDAIFVNALATNNNLTNITVLIDEGSNDALIVNGHNNNFTNIDITSTGTADDGIRMSGGTSNRFVNISMLLGGTGSDQYGFNLDASSHRNFFDCRGGFIDGNGTSPIGFYALSNSSTVQNCTLFNFTTGIRLSGDASNSTFNYNNVSNSGIYGINFSDATNINNTVLGNYFCDSGTTDAHDEDGNTWTNNTCDSVSGNAYCPTDCVGGQFTPAKNRFLIRNTSSDNVASIDDRGYMFLRGTTSESQSSLTPTPNSFIITNSTADTVAYINSTGYLFLLGSATEQATMTTTGNNFEIHNSSDDVVAFIDSQGNLNLLRHLYEQHTDP